MPVATTPLTGAELVPIVQGGINCSVLASTFGGISFVQQSASVPLNVIDSDTTHANGFLYYDVTVDCANNDHLKFWQYTLDGPNITYQPLMTVVLRINVFNAPATTFLPFYFYVDAGDATSLTQIFKGAFAVTTFYNTGDVHNGASGSTETSGRDQYTTNVGPAVLIDIHSWPRGSSGDKAGPEYLIDLATGKSIAYSNTALELCNGITPYNSYVFNYTGGQEFAALSGSITSGGTNSATTTVFPYPNTVSRVVRGLVITQRFNTLFEIELIVYSTTYLTYSGNSSAAPTAIAGTVQVGSTNVEFFVPLTYNSYGAVDTQDGANLGGGNSFYAGRVLKTVTCEIANGNNDDYYSDTLGYQYTDLTTGLSGSYNYYITIRPLVCLGYEISGFTPD